MKRIILALVLNIVSLLYFIQPVQVSAAVAITPPQGSVGTFISVSGLTAAAAYVVKWDGYPVASGTVPAGGVISFSAPEQPRGPHAIIVENPVATVVFTGSFSIIPSFEVEPNIGSYFGDVINVTGRGFASYESNIFVTFDGVAIIQRTAADAYGTWYASFPTPSSIGGTHYINAFGSITHHGEAPNHPILIRPAINISPSRGCVGTSVIISGTGFASLETGISIIFGSILVRSNIVSNPDGTWNASFVVPNAPKGPHYLWISGDITRGYDIGNTVFTVTASAFIDPVSGRVGDTIRIFGKGFASNETGITINYDQLNVKTDIQADGSGTWSSSIVIPPSISGVHEIGAFGTETTSLNCSNTLLTVQPQITISPSGGNVGDTIGVIGNGFGGQKSLTVTYGSNVVMSGVLTDGKGSFTSSFKAPGGRSGAINVAVTDSLGGTANVVFAMETTPPPVPQLVAPSDGSTVGLIGSSRVDFQWTDVFDPSGVSYTLEVSPQSTFAYTVIKVANLNSPQYMLTEAEALPHGDYYWRIRAIDRATNASDWTVVSLVKVSYLSTLTFVIIMVIIAVAAVLVLVFWIIYRNKKKPQPSKE